MFFLLLAASLSALAHLVQRVRRSAHWRAPLRWGIGSAFLLTGIDHFVHLKVRYLPMMPLYLGDWATELVILSGTLEIVGAIGLLLPNSAWTRLGLPSLRSSAGAGLVMLLSVMVIANSHMAEIGRETAALGAGAGYLAIRPLLQPLIVLWVLIAAELLCPPRRVRIIPPNM